MTTLSEVTKPVRTLVLCFDGTSNEYDRMNTNVVKFFAILKKDDFNEQLCYYQPGIGTFFDPGIVSPLFEWLAKIADQAIAWYLDQHVIEGYRFLMQNYRVGDRICLFGFSRGAYTARALGGMLHKVGLLPRDNHQQIPFAYKLYVREDPVGIELSAGFKETYCQDVKIEFMGVWDTVASVGVLRGQTLPFISSNSAIKTFRHALSLDERRAKFRPNVYHYPTPDEVSDEHAPERQTTILDDSELNHSPTSLTNLARSQFEEGSSSGKGPRRKASSGFFGRFFGQTKKTEPPATKIGARQSRDAKMVPGVDTDVLEVWFAGCHSDVGGGTVKDSVANSISHIPLRWMVREVMAAQCGVQFDQAALGRLNIPLAFPVIPSTTLKLAKSDEGEGQLKLVPDQLNFSDANPALEMEQQDAVTQIHDQLKAQKLWWLLEIIPLHYSWQEMDGSWVRSFRSNFGKGRQILDERPNLHRSVKIRMDDPALGYKPRASWSAWILMTDFIRPRDLKLEPNVSKEPNQVKSSFHLVEEDIGLFMDNYTQTPDPTVVARLVQRIEHWMAFWSPSLLFPTTFHSAYNSAFQTYLFSILPTSFSGAFKQLIVSTVAPVNETQIQMQVNDLWGTFDYIGLTDRYESLIASVGYEHIEQHVLETCTGQWAEPMLSGLRDWMTDRMVPWMLVVYGRSATTADEARAMLSGVGPRFDFHMAKTLCDLRTKEIFDIIIDFPDSMGALQDLKECLQRVDQRAALVQSLRQSHRKRLLHPGADTKLILSQYVATIKCLRVVDPPGVLLFKVADPIRRYLRERPDTIRSIVANLVGDDDGGDSLVDESEPPRPLQLADADEYIDVNWEPEPVDAGPDFRVNKPSDIISTLVSIYDSKDFFVKELQVLLAQRLLNVTDDQSDRVEKERRNIEILKIRFGEAALQVCEVMLKDMTDSKRTDQHIQSQQSSVLHPLIISKHFWPALDASEIKMPGQLKELQTQYEAEFNKFKPDKRLRWLSHLGTINITLELEDRDLTVDVLPLEAAVIELFSQKDEWTVEDLSTGLGLPDSSAVLRAINTWIGIGVLALVSPGTYRLLEVPNEGSNAAQNYAQPAASVEVELPPAVSVQQQQAEQMRVYWKFIEGMLTNLGTLPLDRIQNMLKFAPNYDRTIDQLAAFMEAARREDLVTVRDGMWRLNK
ncbi:hypothetical protein ONZ45_g15310 [Pleurotus djamor]|nr:hypothetical protein ONZ45_g15310 [Pleurotus djamor]